jgi:hypothetical protein
MVTKALLGNFTPLVTSKARSVGPSGEQAPRRVRIWSSANNGSAVHP